MTRQSFVSVISEESETFYKDPLKADTCSATAPLFTENNFSEMEDMKVCHCIKFSWASCM